MYRLTRSKSLFMMSLVALTALLISACVPITPVPPTEAPSTEATPTPAPEAETVGDAETLTLEGVSWQLVEYLNANDELVTAEVAAGATFADGQVSGSAGCNNFFAAYTVDGSQLTIEQAGSTMMACEEPAMAQEQAVLTRLAEAAAYEIVDGQLHIVDADGNLLLAFAPVAAASLTDVTWQLSEYLNMNGELTVAEVEATVTFEDGRVSGSAGCNSFSAGYTVDGQQLTIDQAVSTAMACEEAAMAQEQAVLVRLSEAASYAIVDNQLQILDANGNLLLVFTPLEAASLTGVTWVATSYNNGNQAVVSVLAGTELTAVFGEDGSLSGKAGCNNFMSSYTVDGDQITISPAATTRMMCAEPAGIMEQEAAFVMALETAATYSIQGDTLEMRTADGALVASFVAG